MMPSPRITRITAGIVLGLVTQALRADEPKSGLERMARALAKTQFERSFRSMNRPFAPFRVIGNIYYVGAAGVSSYLITTPKGHILVDSGFAETVPRILEGVQTLGFRVEDIKVLLNSHAHLDHAGGHSLLKAETGAQVVMSREEANLLARGGKGDVLPVDDDLVSYEPAKADRIIGDHDQVELGGVTLTAHLTPGHTKGCTTWTMAVAEGGTRHEVVFFGGTTLLPGVRLVDNPEYPTMAADFARSFRILKSLPCDVFLAPHGSYFGLEEKARRQKAGAGPNPFIDPDGYREYLKRAEQVFREQLARERAAASSKN